MREAIAGAEVGDEQIGDDPSVNVLCERVADLLGKEAAVVHALRHHVQHRRDACALPPGDEILARESAHIIAREGGAHAALGGFQIMPLPGADGQFSPEAFREALHPRSRYQPPQTVVSVEQTANIGGGTIWKKAALDEVVQIAKSHGLATHMDGARLLNACVATGIGAREMAAGWGFPPGSTSPGTRRARQGAAIAGTRDFVDEVWRWKQRLGGSMRQAGICAAACTYALDHHVDRLADDHANARALARGLSQISGMEIQQPETNLVFFNPARAGVTGDQMVEALRERGVLLAMMDGRIRACARLDVTGRMIGTGWGLVREIVQQQRTEDDARSSWLSIHVPADRLLLSAS